MKLIALLFFPILSFAQIKPDKTISLLDNKVELLVPKELSKMSDEMWTLKYHNLQRPELVLTDVNGEINLLVELTQQPAAESQIAAYKDFRISNLKESRKDIKILQDGIKTVNGKNIGFIKFSSHASDQNIFNFYFFTVVKGNILFFTFNCIEKLQKSWEKTADEMLASIKIK
jgi:hypothetical protein